MIDCQGGDHRDAPHRGQERPPARGAERGGALSMRSERLSRRATDSESRVIVKVTLHSPSQSRSQVVHRPRRWVKVEVKSRYCAPQSVKVTLQEAVTSHARFLGVTPTLNRKHPRTPCDATGASAALHTWWGMAHRGPERSDRVCLRASRVATRAHPNARWRRSSPRTAAGRTLGNSSVRR